MTEFAEPPSSEPRIDPHVPNLARMYDYYLGGMYNFPADRAKAERVHAVLPSVDMLARSNRSFLRRAVRFMVDQGIKQFLDLGSGIPTVGNVHEVAQARNASARVVYVDYDPVAVSHSELILAETANAAMVGADIRQPEKVLNHPRVRELLNLDEPLGVVMNGVLVFVADSDDPAGLVATYRDACASGSYIAVSHLTDDEADPETRIQVRKMVEVYQGVTAQLYVRDRKTFTEWFDGTELVSPGVTLMPDWRPERSIDVDPMTPARMLGYGAVGRVP